MLSMLGKNFSRRHFEIFFCIFPANRFKHSQERNCINCQSLFPGKLSTELAQKDVKVRANGYTTRLQGRLLWPENTSLFIGLDKGGYLVNIFLISP